MKLSESIILSLSVAFFIIGVHQTFVLGIAQSYWLFMLSVTMLLLYKLKKRKQPEETPNHSVKQPKKNITSPKAKSRK